MAHVKRQKDYAVMKYVADYRIGKMTNQLSTTIKNQDKTKDLIFNIPYMDALIGIEVHFEKNLSKEIYFDFYDVYSKYNPNNLASYMDFVTHYIGSIDEPGFSIGRNSKSGHATIKQVIMRETDGRSDALTEITIMIGGIKFEIAKMDAQEPYTNSELYEWYDDYDLHDATGRIFKGIGLGIVAIVGLILTIAVNPAFLILMLPALGGAGYFGFTGFKKNQAYRKAHPLKKDEEKKG
jgi:hypothetical protein